MTQNIYDTATFFDAYSQLPRSLQGLDGAPEWPSLRRLLPDLGAARVLDLGCGFGWFCRFAQEQGAARVLGVDVSERMLARAAAETQSAAITYLQADLETFDPRPETFDLAYSSLAFHYLDDLAGLLARIHAALAPGSRLVCSVEHPLMTAPAAQGWSQDGDGRATWPVNGYIDEGLRKTDWLAKGVLKHHRMIGTYVALLLSAGFTLSHLEEWGPSREQVALHPEWTGSASGPVSSCWPASACDGLSRASQKARFSKRRPWLTLAPVVRGTS